VRLISGLLKGGIIGGALGFGFMHLPGLAQLGFVHYLLYGVIGALVGFIAGRPFWRHETLWTPIVKAVVGFGICLGLYALVVKVFGDPKLSFVGLNASASAVPYALGAAIGIVYGVFVEIDDGGKADKEKPPAPKQLEK
jgi:hypothetical protein